MSGETVDITVTLPVAVVRRARKPTMERRAAEEAFIRALMDTPLPGPVQVGHYAKGPRGIEYLVLCIDGDVAGVVRKRDGIHAWLRLDILTYSRPAEEATS